MTVPPKYLGNRVHFELTCIAPASVDHGWRDPRNHDQPRLFVVNEAPELGIGRFAKLADDLPIPLVVGHRRSN